MMSYILEAIAQFYHEKNGLDFSNNQIDFLSQKVEQFYKNQKYPSLEVFFVDFQKNDKIKTQLLEFLTTHYTFFFREFIHFEWLLKQSDWIHSVAQKRPLRVWSAACSYGHEIYSLALFFDYHYPQISVEFLASDISRQALQIAQNGVYPFEEVAKIPSLYLNNHWVRGKNQLSQYAKIKDAIHKKIRFFYGNLIDPTTFPPAPIDLVFCRNVFIYFSQDSIDKALKNMSHVMTPEKSFLILGVSDSLAKTPPSFHNLSHGIYMFSSLEQTHLTPTQMVPSPAPFLKAKAHKDERPSIDSISELSEPIRVFLVDDSQVVIKIVSRIFETDPHFKVVGSASNGQEALEKIQKVPFDIMILDLHMPIMNGLEYLQNRPEKHPPILILSSVSRQDSQYALRALELGAVDYIEKPVQSKWDESSYEILTKSKLAFRMKDLKPSQRHFQFEKVFSWQRMIPKVDEGLVVLILTRAQIDFLPLYIEALNKPSPFLLILIDSSFADSESELVSIQKRIQPICPVVSHFKPNTCQILPLSQLSHVDSFLSKKTLFVLFHLPYPEHLSTICSRFPPQQILMHDLLESARIPECLSSQMIRLSPLTSFAYHTYEFFLEEKL